MSKLNSEPSLDKIDDYNGKESKEKNRTVKLVIVGILIVGAIYAGAKYYFSDVNDYIGTEQSPGINTSKN
ncbi:MAG: hypothetical protein RBR07_03575 [Arcobacteraceae bacterium]|nr:hypothetical protein [Arcobacteraceae bacterium]